MYIITRFDLPATSISKCQVSKWHIYLPLIKKKQKYISQLHQNRTRKKCSNDKNKWKKNTFPKIIWKKMLKIDFLYELCPFIAKIHKLSLIHTKSIFGYVSLIYFVLNGIFNVFCSLSVIENIQIKKISAI